MSSEFPSDFSEERTDSQFPEEVPEETYRPEPIQPIFYLMEELRAMMEAQSQRGTSMPMIEPPPEEELG